MKKIFTFVLSFLLLISLTSVSVLAWSAPTINKKYEEELEEFRAVWVCTVSNMDMPRQSGTSEASINAWKNAYLKVLDDAISRGLNAIIFQVRPGNDAFYPSKYNPWSEYLCGFGVNPGWDPLAWMVEVTHEAGLEYHAWLNPYRASITKLDFNYVVEDAQTKLTSIHDYDETALVNYKQAYYKDLKDTWLKNNQPIDNPIFYEGDELNHAVVLGTEGKFVLNPASPKVLNHLNNTIDELVTNYDLDGIHFDDYFYPNNVTYKGENTTYRNNEYSTEPYVDHRDYQAYVQAGGTLTMGNWRRDNVNRLIESLSNIIRTKNQTKKVKCAFGISPCTLWAPSPESCPAGSDRGAEGGMNAPCNNYYAYSDLYADTYKWVKEDWIDYIVPQNYTNLGDSAAGVPTGSYNTNAKWWSDAIKGYNTKLYMGTAVYQVDSWVSAKNATSQEIYYQIRWNQYRDYNIDGYIYFRYKSMLQNLGGTSTENVQKYLWKNAALTPTYASYEYPQVTDYAKGTNLDKNADGSYTLSFSKVDDAKAYGILEDGKNIALVLKSASSITFKATEGKTYELVTYGYDNNPFNVSYNVDINNAYVNQAPVITFNTTLEKTYKTGSKLSISFDVNDIENDELTYAIKFVSTSLGEFDLVRETAVKSSPITYDFDVYYTPATNCKFIITVKDASNVTTYESALFDIISEGGTTLPTTLYDIIYETNGGKLPADAQTFYGGEVYILPIPTKSGYTFSGWYDNPEFTGEAIDVIEANETGNKTFYAKFDKKPASTGGMCNTKAASVVVSLISTLSIVALIMKKED